MKTEVWHVEAYRWTDKMPRGQHESIITTICSVKHWIKRDLAINREKLVNKKGRNGFLDLEIL